MDKKSPNNLNRRARRAMKKKGTTERILDRKASEQELSEAKKYKMSMDAESVEKRNRFKEFLAKVRRSKEHYQLPETVPLERMPEITRVKVVNKDGRQRELLPDVPGQHKILCHRALAKAIPSGVCILVRITENPDGGPQDGSWAMCPEQLAMSRTTTIQTVRRRSWWWLRRYSYEISFDGRIQPAAMFWDYGINPESESLSFYVTHETIKVKHTDELNHYYRFWLNKPEK